MKPQTISDEAHFGAATRAATGAAMRSSKRKAISLFFVLALALPASQLFAPPCSITATEAEISAYADTLSVRYKVPAIIIKAVIEQESRWNPNAYNANDGGVGLMQVTPQPAGNTQFTLGVVDGSHSNGENAFTLTTQTATVDLARLCSDWRYNMEIGVRILLTKVVISESQRLDLRILENWYYPLAFYNGAAIYNGNNPDSNDPINPAYSRNPRNNVNNDWISKLDPAVFPYQECIFNIIAQKYSIPASRSDYFGDPTQVILPGPASVQSGAGHYNYLHSSFHFHDYAEFYRNHTAKVGSHPGVIYNDVPFNEVQYGTGRLDVISIGNGVGVPNVAPSVDGISVGSTDLNGQCYLPVRFCGSHLVEANLGTLHYTGTVNFVCPLMRGLPPASGLRRQPNEIEGSDDIYPIPMESDGSCTPAVNNFVVGDVVEVFGTGNGLRARHPDPCSTSYIVMPDSSIGTIVGGPQCCNGYVRWKIRYNSISTIDLWSAEREPSTGQSFLRLHSPGGNVPTAPSNLAAHAVSTSQINLTWTDRSTNETGFTLERATNSGGPWGSVVTTTSNAQAYSDLGRAPGTTYYYRVKAINSFGSSAYSNTANATTQQSPGTTATLTIASSNPSSGVSVASFVGTTGYQTGITPTSRTFPVGTTVGVTCPQTLTGGQIFQKWRLDGSDYAFATYVTIVMNSVHTLTAVYGTSPPPARTLSSLAVEGPSSLDENTSAQYRARATYTDGSSAYVAASWSEDSSYATISSNGVLDAGAVSTDRAIEVRADYSEGGVSRSKIKDVTIRNTNTVASYTLTINSTGGGSVGYSPHGNSYPAGTVVSLHANPDGSYIFSHWSGDASGTEDDITIRMDGNRSVTAHFVLDPSEGALRVNLFPPQAVAEGAQWRYDNFTAWRNSGETQTNISPRVNRYVHFRGIPGWVSPDEIQATIVGTQTTVVNATYREILGAVQVTITPLEAATAGGRWRLDGGPWQESSVTLQNVATGSHMIEFSAISGWTTPLSQTVSVERGVTSTRSGNYTPPVGFPLIISVFPRTGPISGGTIVTIDGASFQPGASVMFDGISATSVTVVSSTRITAVTPPHSSYGTVPLSLTSGGQTVTEANGFSYLNPLGSNIELVGHIGGNVAAVAMVGNTVYYGEGPGLVVSDFTNSAAPVERGRIALPADVRDLVVANNVAFVAIGGAGLYAVDVSNPTAPSIVGFFDTEGSATGVTVSEGVAYVADGSAGLLILNITNPTAITRLGLLDTAGRAARVSVGTIASRKYAFVAEGDLAMRVIDVTTPNAPVEITSVPALGPAGIIDVKIVGTKLYVADWQSLIKIFDASNPANLVQIGSRNNVGGGALLDVVGNRLYTCSGILRVFDLSVLPTPTELGTYDAGPFCDKLVVANNLAFAAMRRDGLKVVSVSNPASMSLRSAIQTLSDVEDVWISGSVALVGNDSGLHTLNVSNPAYPLRLATLAGDRVTGIVAADGKATLVNYGEPIVRIANVTNPSSLSLLGTYLGVEGWNVALMGSNPVLAAATNNAAHLPKLDVLDISSPSNPQSIGSVLLDSTIGTADSIAIVGTWAFVGRHNTALDVVSLANPSSPQKVGSVAIPNFFRDVAASEDGNYVYVADTSLGIQVVDVTTKTAPVLGQVIDPPQTTLMGAQSVCVSGNRLFATEGGYIFAFDISNHASPQILGFYDNPGSGYGITVVNDLIFVADYHAGLSILRLMDVDNPTITITSPTTNSTYATENALISLAGSASDNQEVARVSWENNRGGSGVATGTTTWQISGIQLVPGANILTVTAEDGNGNLATDTLTVTTTFADTAPPVVKIIEPRPDAQYTVNTASIAMSGTAADGTAVAQVNWNNDRGGNGIATGTTAWTIADVPLFDGPNVITITASDSAENVGAQSQIITFVTDDTTAPSIELDFPTINPTWTTFDSTFNASGMSADNRAVALVIWTNDRGGSGTAFGTDTWFVNDIPLELGANLITVTATDAAGNVATDTLIVDRAGTAPTPSPTPAPSATPTPSPVLPAQFGNISTRLKVETGDNVLIGGFIISGTQPKTVIVRGIGPSLISFGIAGALADPLLELHGPGAFVTITNDNWRDDPVQAALIQATGVQPSNDLESAIVATLPANGSAYTAIVRGVNNGTGIGVVEAYDLDQTVNSRLANISTRGFVNTGENVMIGGMIVVGNTSGNVLIRAIGPSLAGFGVPNPLEDPTLELRNSSGVLLASNDNWRTDQEAEITATGIPPTDNLESAILWGLPPGAYTAIVRGNGNSTGVALIEAYQLP